MLKITNDGIVYNGSLYKISKNDIEWLLQENKKNPMLHPARNLRSLSSTIYPID